MNLPLTTKTMKANNMMNALKMIGATLLAFSVTACVNHDDYYRSDQYRKPVAPIILDVPPQVIYRIDDHRYISLENYDICSGDTYYNDTKRSIKTKLGSNGIERYRGRLVIDDPTEMNIVIPSAPQGSCGSRGCDSSLIYSTDGGRTFKGKVYMNGQIPAKDSENYSILVAKDGFYVVKTLEYAKGKFDNDITKYPLAPGIEYGTREGLPSGYRIEYLSNKPLPPFRTPSGQDRFICDATIRPSNLPKEK